MRKGLIIVISGPAGSGKGTVIKLLREKLPDLRLSVSATTRDPRPGEEEGVHYYFITKAEFEKRIADGEILEYNYYCDNYYGTPKSELKRLSEGGHDVILEIDVNGGLQVKKLFPDSIAVMLVPPTAKMLEERLRGRGTETEEVIKARLKRAEEEMELLGKYDYLAINDDGKADECAALLEGIIKAEHVRTDRVADFPESFFGKKKNNKSNI